MPKKYIFILVLGGLLCLFSVPLACGFGPVRLGFGDVWRSLLGLAPAGEVYGVTPEGVRQLVDRDTLGLLIRDMRLPRILLALLVGCGLSCSGTVFQGVLRNPLADPFTLGVSGGAALGAALAISLGFTSFLGGFGLPAAAFAGAGAALGLVLYMGNAGGGLRREVLILAGVAVSAFLAALIALVKALDESSVTGIVFWLMGGFQGRGARELQLLLPGLCIGLAVAFVLRRELDLLLFGDAEAKAAGVSAATARALLLAGAGLAAASCVAVSGIIGFVGLVVPHLCRQLVGTAAARLLPLSALAGGLLLLWADTAARTLLPGGVELPVAVLTALIGGPFFCFLTAREAKARARGLPSFALRFFPSLNGEKTQSVLSRKAVRGEEPRVSLEAEGMAAKYGTRKVFGNISLALRPGSFTALIGQNGAGKSTLLSCLAGLQPLAAGQVRLAGPEHSLNPHEAGERRRARMLAFLPQAQENIPVLTVFETVSAGRYCRIPFAGGYSAKDHAAAWAALEETSATHLAGRPLPALSGGELRRVLLARVFAQEAPVIILDEPTAGLDPACAVQILQVLRRKAEEGGFTVLASLHDVNLAGVYAHDLCALHGGTLVAAGPIKETFTAALMETVFETPVRLAPHPENGLPQAFFLSPRSTGLGGGL